MALIWLNGTVGAGKSAVGQALACALPCAVFLDGDDHAGLPHFPGPARWRVALQAMLRAAARPGSLPTLVVAYPLDRSGFAQLKAVCGRARRPCIVINLASPLAMTLRGRGGRRLDAAERARARGMRSKGYHRRPFASATLPNAHPPAERTARRIARLFKEAIHPRSPAGLATVEHSTGVPFGAARVHRPSDELTK